MGRKNYEDRKKNSQRDDEKMDSVDNKIGECFIIGDEDLQKEINENKSSWPVK